MSQQHAPIQLSVDEASPHAKKQRHFSNLWFIIILILLGSFILFIAADDIEARFVDLASIWRDLLEAIKTLALAGIVGVIAAMIDHYRTIEEANTKVAEQISTLVSTNLRTVATSLPALVAAGIKQDTLLESQEKYGLLGYVDKMPFHELFLHLREGDELLWLDTYCPAYSDFIGEVVPALRKGARIRMLIIDPRCQNARWRAEEIRGPFDYPQFLRGVESFTKSIVEELNKEKQITKDRCEIRVYQDLPCVPMYIILHEGKLFEGYSSFFLTEPTAYFPHLKWRPTSPWYQSDHKPAYQGTLDDMRAYFERKWETQRSRGKILFPTEPPQTQLDRNRSAM